MGHDIIVIGASAGGVEALRELVKALTADFPAAILIVLHIPAYSASALPDILARAGLLPAQHPSSDTPLQPGNIYVAPPNQHLLVKNGFVTLARGPHENGHRPAVDPLFRSAAREYGRRVIGVILSGVLDDGTAGLLAVKMRGGIAVVQDPADALYDGMPRSAIENVDVDYIVPIEAMASLLTRLANEPVSDVPALPVSEQMAVEADMAELDVEAMQKPDRPGTPSAFVCPDCGGTLFEIQDAHLTRYRCRVGHAFSPETLLAAQSDRLEDAFWVALRALEESASLSRRMAARAREQGHTHSALRHEEQAQAAQERAALVREVLLIGTLNGRGEATQNTRDELTS